ncbi:hypothetical protein ACFL1C_02330 [Pseudomonadota bacterium]|jgi:hypothetical protein
MRVSRPGHQIVHAVSERFDSVVSIIANTYPELLEFGFLLCLLLRGNGLVLP